MQSCIEKAKVGDEIILCYNPEYIRHYYGQQDYYNFPNYSFKARIIKTYSDAFPALIIANNDVPRTLFSYRRDYEEDFKSNSSIMDPFTCFSFCEAKNVYLSLFIIHKIIKK